jgi:hypothetical protein
MGHQPTSRRGFFSRFTNPKNEKVKLLTSDGRLVEVDRQVIDQAREQKKASNREIYRWMDNPSKKEDE